MTGDEDFEALYRELRVAPDDGVEAFRQAYRRRVGEIHPDRTGPAGDADLRRLNVGYGAAMRFERRFGRLPGATTARSRPAVGPAAPVATGSGTVRRRGSLRGYLLAAATLAVAVAVPWWNADDAPPSHEQVIERTPAKPSPMATASIELGATVAEVLAVQGAPVATDGDRWLYGPSWLMFRCLEVSDWYSSPLYALKTESPQPSALARRRHRPSRGEDCGKRARP